LLDANQSSAPPEAIALMGKHQRYGGCFLGSVFFDAVLIARLTVYNLLQQTASFSFVNFNELVQAAR
jgi:hypothetical protein